MRAAMIRKPACSKRRYTSPIRLRLTPSGLTIERVRSSAISGSSGKRPARQFTRSRRDPSASDREALPAAAFTLDIWIAEAERLVQPLLDEIDDRSIEQGETGRIDEHLHPPVLEH